MTITELCEKLELGWDREIGDALPLSPSVVSPPRPDKWRRNAEAMLSKTQKRESTLKLEQEREHDAMVEKTARLRELRLAKEAADREAAALKPATRTKTQRQGQK